MSAAEQRTKRRQLREQTREQILRAAEAVLREGSFRDLSVEAVMSRTGHTRTVFYRHFDDVPSLVLTLMQEIASELVDVAQEWAQQGRVGPDEARRRLALFVDFYVRHGPLVRAVAQAAHLDEDVEAAYTGLVEGFISITTQAIEARIESGEVGQLDAPDIARALVRMLNGYLGDTLGRADSGADPERVLDTIWTIWTRTLFPESTAGETGRFNARTGGLADRD